jgi:predicted permease
VTEVGVGTLPLRRAGNWLDVEGEGRQVPPGQARPRADWRYADMHYFDAAGIPLVSGRNFTAADEPIGDSLVIVNKTFAERVFPGEDPVGRRMMLSSATMRALYPQALHWRTIVGVVGDTRDGELDAKPEPAMYSPQFGAPLNGGLAIRAEANVANLIPAVTKVVRRISPTAMMEEMMTIQQYKSTSVSAKRLNATLISSFAMLALLIAAVGIGGVLAFSVSARVNEIGIRMSLGADPGTVERMILKEGSVLVVSGLLLGLVGALVTGRIIQGLLYDVTPGDPPTLLAAAAIMTVSGIVACWIPALRAARVDPAITMRAQ